jgi:predicted transcriptional regulator
MRGGTQRFKNRLKHAKEDVILESPKRFNMSNAVADRIRVQVLKYLDGREPVKLSSMAADLRQSHANLSDADVRDVVQPMIATGKLSYAPGLKIKLAKP